LRRGGPRSEDPSGPGRIKERRPRAIATDRVANEARRVAEDAPMRVIHHPAYEVDIGVHVFPTRKYRLVREWLLAERIVAAADFLPPQPVTDDDVRLVHTAGYVAKIREDRLSQMERLTLEVPFSAALRESMWLCAGGTWLTARRALADGAALHLGGGFHHAFPDHGEGFCLIHDVAIAIRMLQRDATIRRALVVDLDVHHGNGTAAIFAGDASVFTFSMHQQNNYPAWKPPSDLDLGLPDGTGDGDYLALLERHLPEILDTHAPDLVLYLAGADPYERDQLGGLGLTIDGLRQRDAFVLETARARGVPVAVTLAGGYAANERDTVEIHVNTVREAARQASGAEGQG
jgi:acetoin utilization deacetylase AcuC-like enzyme